MPDKLIFFGLGNPGRRYQWTRHNLGFHVLDAVAERHAAVWSSSARTFERTEVHIGVKRILLIKPTTYVNLSGEAVLELDRYTEFEDEELVAVADDIALPLGQLRVRPRGSHGGHNGLRSIIDALGTSAFPRLRMGVGPVPNRIDPADFVLSRFRGDERDTVADVIARALRCVEDIAGEGVEYAMNRHNAPPARGEGD